MGNSKKHTHLACGFSLKEQIYAQITFHGWWISGFVGIALQNWIWAILYLFIVAYGILGIIQRHLTCPRCPHLHEYDSCLQLPKRITKYVIKARKNTPFSPSEKILFISIFILITIFPIYWLKNDNIALAGFLLFGSMWCLGQFFYFCKRCRIPSCPFNRAKIV
jgi:hypothetical protein